MSKTEIQVASQSVTRNIFIRNATTGLGLTGLVYNSTGLTAYYVLNQAASVSIPLVTQTITGGWSSGGFVEIDSTNFAGLYRFDIPNAAIASGPYSDIMFRGAANMIDEPIEIELTAVNNQDGVRYGMTALPNSTNLAVSAGLIIPGVAATGTLSSTQMSCTGSAAVGTDSLYVGRNIMWTSGVLAGSFALISAYNHTTTVYTYGTTTTGAAPSNGDTFVII